MKKWSDRFWLRAAIGCMFGLMPLEASVMRGEMKLGASWNDLRYADTVLTLTTPAVLLRIANNEAVDVTATVTWRLNDRPAGGQLIVGLRPLEVRVVSVPVSLSLLAAESQRFSGRLVAEISATTASSRLATSIALPPLYFHADRGNMLVYAGQVLRSRFAGGNFRNEAIDTATPALQLRRALLDARAPALEPIVARVGVARTMSNLVTPPSGGGGRRFCLAMPGWPYVESSNGEDLGTAGQTIPLVRAWVSLSQAGNPLFSGFLDTSGCTPYVAAAANAPTLLVLSPLYFNGTRNLRGFVSDLNLGQNWPQSMPLFFLNFESDNAATTNVLADTSDYVQTIFAAAVQGLERFPGGITNATYEWQLRVSGDNSGTGTDYAPEGHPRVHIKFSQSAREKFTVVHEYGHAVLMSKLNPHIGGNDLDYSVTDDEAEQHTLNSKEWQLAAAIEGFAHFVAAVAWNDVSAAPGAYFVDGTTAYDLSVFDKYFETNWNAANYAGQGVERDWAQFFWNYHTDAPTLPGVFSPDQATLVAVWQAAYTWPKHEGFFADLAAAAAAVLPAAPLPFPANSPYQWFVAVASQAGIVH
jgi:hypothetical protein